MRLGRDDAVEAGVDGHGYAATNDGWELGSAAQRQNARPNARLVEDDQGAGFKLGPKLQ